MVSPVEVLSLFSVGWKDVTEAGMCFTPEGITEERGRDMLLMGARPDPLQSLIAHQ